MIDLLSGLLGTVGGLIVFAGAYYVHQKVRLTRTACVMATVAGFVTYSGVIGSWANQYARQIGVFSAVAVVVGICVIVADIKGKKKGADRPALFAFFLVPIFLVSGLVAVSTVVAPALQRGVEKTGTQMQRIG
jgi:hypothetical protein